MNDINSISGIDDFADEMKKNLCALRELQAKYEKALAFVKNMSTWNDENSPPDIAQAGQIARELLRELG